MDHVFQEVKPEIFEAAISKAPQEKLDKERDYTGKRLFLNQDHSVGYALGHDGYWGNLFSLAKGGGSAAAKDAIARGALYGNAFETPENNNLIDFYGKFGFQPFAREKNWTEGQPDIVHIKLPHAPVPSHLQERIASGEIEEIPQAMSKSERLQAIIKAAKRVRVTPHPHAYEWHDGHTSHHGAMLKADLADIEDKGKAFQHEANEQVATVGVPTYHEYAKHFGHIDKNAAPHQSNYDYRNVTAGVNDLLKRHGYQVYIAGGKHGKPDLGSRNYDTSHLMIYDPTPDSGGDQGDEAQTKNWRIVHELAHALTREQLNNTEIPGFPGEVYGERPRMGRLGKQRPLRDAMRAVHWEALAAAKQRELSRDLGINISDPQFAQEMNTVLHDAAHRAVTGRFSEPRKEGFHPSDKMPTVHQALNLVREAASQMGLQGLDDLAVKKSEEKEMKIPKVQYNVEKACWEGYEQYGMKEKKGRQVPNCVPKKKTKKSEPDLGEMMAKNLDAYPNFQGDVKSHDTKFAKMHRYDYSHALPEDMKNSGMRMIVEHRIPTSKHLERGKMLHPTVSGVIFDSSGKALAHTMGIVDGERIMPHIAALQYKNIGKGLATIATEAALAHAGRHLGTKEVHFPALSTNVIGIMDRVSKKLGMNVVNEPKQLEATVEGRTPFASQSAKEGVRSEFGRQFTSGARTGPKVPVTHSDAKYSFSKNEPDLGEMMVKTEELLAQVRLMKEESSEYAGHMVKANLYKIAKSAQELYELFNDDENVEPWVEEKIAICANNIDTVADYMQYERMRQGRAEDEVGLGEGEEQVDEYPQSDEMTKAEGDKKYSKKVKNKETGREKTVRYGAKGYTIAPGTSRGDSYCARSYGQMKDHPAAAKDPNSPLRLSRKKWKCSGKTSRKNEVDFGEMMAKTEELLAQVKKLKGE